MRPLGDGEADGEKVALSQNTVLDVVLQTTVEANGVVLGVERLGQATAPLVLLAGGPTMLSWPDALCAALARGGRHVVR